MKSFRLYLVFFGVVMIGYVIYEMTSPKNIHWMVTFDDKDKNPFGAYLLDQRFTDLFPSALKKSHETLSQMEAGTNVLILAERPEIGQADIARLFELLDSGSHIFIAANRFGSELQDSLGFTTDYRFKLYGLDIMESTESWMSIGKKRYYYPEELMDESFEIEEEQDWKILAKTENGPMAISKSIGNGKLTLVCNPLIFTNFGLLYGENFTGAQELLKVLPYSSVLYTKYYQFGRSEASTPLRYFLSQPALKWSLLMSFGCIMVLLIVDSWRRQRKIDVVEPPENASLNYTKTLGGLFYREGNHYRAAMKLINHFFMEIREKYLLEPEFNSKFYSKLAGKAGVDTDHVNYTFQLIELIRKTPRLEESKLIELSKKIDVFK